MRRPHELLFLVGFTSKRSLVWIVVGAWIVSSQFLVAATPDEMRFFEEQVRPILATKCLKCHGDEKQKGGLRLDSSEALLAGGDSGPAVMPGKPADSLLIEAINY